MSLKAVILTVCGIFLSSVDCIPKLHWGPWWWLVSLLCCKYAEFRLDLCILLPTVIQWLLAVIANAYTIQIISWFFNMPVRLETVQVLLKVVIDRGSHDLRVSWPVLWSRDSSALEFILSRSRSRDLKSKVSVSVLVSRPDGQSLGLGLEI